MKLYVDSAERALVLELLSAGLVSGVTSNPTIVAAAGLTAADLPELYADFTAAGASEVFFQATGSTVPLLRDSAQRIADLGPSVTVKVPATAVGFQVAAQLINRGTPVLISGVFGLSQAVLASAIGAKFVAPYLGHMLDRGNDGLAEITLMGQVLRGSRTSVLAASVRNAEAAVALRMAGVVHITAKPSVVWSLAENPHSDHAAAEFERPRPPGVAEVGAM